LKNGALSLIISECETAVKEICHFIQNTIEEADASGVVVGLSGGVDSSLTVALCVHALGKNKVLGVLLPTNFTPLEDVEDAKKLAAQLDIQTFLVNIQAPCDRLFQDLMPLGQPVGGKMVIANVYARMRMLILYYYANLHHSLVAGTGDRSEALIGFFTKYGDGGADLFPILHLYKTQVRQLAQYLGVPEEIAQKPSSPQLYPGHKATDEIPLDYELLDPVLVGLFDRKLQLMEISRLTNVPIEIIHEILRMFNSSRHKRVLPPSLKTS